MSPGTFMLVGERDERILRGQLIGLNTPMRWKTDKGRYETTVRFRLVEPAAANARPLGLTLPVMVSTTADGISESNLEITASNAPIELTVWAQPGSSRVDHQINVVMGSAPPFGGTMKVEKQTLVLRVSPERIQGFGLETARITLEGSDGAGAANLSITRGSLEASSLQTGETAVLRSSGLGEGTITASLLGFEDGKATITYVFPIAFLPSALVGGIFGAGVQWTALGGRKREGANAGISFAIGSLVGLLMAVAWTFGINLVGLKPDSGFNEGVVFLIAAVGVAAGQGPLMKLLGRGR